MHPQIIWWQAIVLGLTQGLTEFIPVSSSAHLNIAHWLFGQPRELTYDVMLHIGTLFALAFFFRHDWLQLLHDPAQRVLRNLILLACVPAAGAGLLLRHLEDQPPLSQVWFNALMLIMAGLALGWADKTGRKARTVRGVTWHDAIIIGGSQALALMPGVSRSGATITAGLWRGLNCEAAARFSFLLALPITLGAVVFEVIGLQKAGGIHSLGASWPIVLLGVLTSAASGAWAIGFLLHHLKTRGVAPFVWWRALVAVAIFILLPFLRTPQAPEAATPFQKTLIALASFSHP